MLDELQKKKLSNMMNSESKDDNDSVAIHKKTVEDANFMGQEDSRKAVNFRRVSTLKTSISRQLSAPNILNVKQSANLCYSFLIHTSQNYTYLFSDTSQVLNTGN